MVQGQFHEIWPLRLNNIKHVTDNPMHGFSGILNIFVWHLVATKMNFCPQFSVRLWAKIFENKLFTCWYGSISDCWYHDIWIIDFWLSIDWVRRNIFGLKFRLKIGQSETSSVLNQSKMTNFHQWRLKNGRFWTINQFF